MWIVTGLVSIYHLRTFPGIPERILLENLEGKMARIGFVFKADIDGVSAVIDSGFQ